MEEPNSDFLNKANIFWKLATSDNCSEIKKKVRYPVLMDGMGIDSDEKLQSRCNAIYTSAKYLRDKSGTSANAPSFILHKSGWLKPEMLAGHPLLKIHVGNDTRFFLLEVISGRSKVHLISFVFRRDYEDSNGKWDIIMMEDYSLTESMKRK
tara:strand:+ start:94 stop:549 length:456 start_codon:yes stop_codon:yes gene_type:complete